MVVSTTTPLLVVVVRTAYHTIQSDSRVEKRGAYKNSASPKRLYGKMVGTGWQLCLAL
jgi:hypothetical protein